MLARSAHSVRNSVLLARGGGGPCDSGVFGSWPQEARPVTAAPQLAVAVPAPSQASPQPVQVAWEIRRPNTAPPAGAIVGQRTLSSAPPPMLLAETATIGAVGQTGGAATESAHSSGVLATPTNGQRCDLSCSLQLGTASFRGSAAPQLGVARVAQVMAGTPPHGSPAGALPPGTRCFPRP